MGVQLEQRAFARLSIPLFARGGGIADRTEIEERTTWDRETLVEDTTFGWAAFRALDVTFALSDAVCRIDAPPSLYEILQQRRRWSAGNVRAATMLALRYELLTDSKRKPRSSGWGGSQSPVANSLSRRGVVRGRRGTVLIDGVSGRTCRDTFGSLRWPSRFRGSSARFTRDTGRRIHVRASGPRDVVRRGPRTRPRRCERSPSRTSRRGYREAGPTRRPRRC